MASQQKSNPDKTRFMFSMTQKFVHLILWVLFGLKVIGKENVPKSGAFILASNHKSFFDPPIIGSTCPREIFFAAKKDLFKIPILGFLVKYYNSIPIRRSGSDKEALFKLIQTLKTGYGIIIFPEGTRFADNILHPPKPGVGLIAVRSNATIVPTYVTGSASLAKQIWKRSLRLNYGKPFTLTDVGLKSDCGKDGYRMMAETIINRIAQVGNVSPPKTN